MVSLVESALGSPAACAVMLAATNTHLKKKQCMSDSKVLLPLALPLPLLLLLLLLLLPLLLLLLLLLLSDHKYSY